MSASEIASIPIRDAMRALVGEWHDINEAGCCDSDDPPYCSESKAYAHGYLAAIASIEHQPQAAGEMAAPTCDYCPHYPHNGMCGKGINGDGRTFCACYGRPR